MPKTFYKTPYDNGTVGLSVHGDGQSFSYTFRDNHAFLAVLGLTPTKPLRCLACHKGAAHAHVADAAIPTTSG